MKRPTIGTPVVYHGHHSNGHDDQPGLVSMCWTQEPAAWGEAKGYCCNLQVFPDCDDKVVFYGSIYVFESQAQATLAGFFSGYATLVEGQ